MNGAKQNPLSMLAAFGEQELASGRVTPEQAAGVMKAAGGEDWLQSYLKPAQQNPYTFAPIDQSMVPKVSAPKGQSAKSEMKKNSEQKSSRVQNTNYSADEFNDLTSIIENMPDVQSQRASIGDLENMIAMQKEIRSPNDGWVKGLSALADAQTGSNLAAAYKPGPTQGDRNKAIIDAMDDLQKRKGDLSKTILDGVGKLKSGSQTDQNNQTMQQLLAFAAGQGGAGRFGDPEERMANANHQRNIQALKKDTNLRQNLANMQRIENGLNNAVGVEKLTNQSFHELQQAIRSSITKGTGGVEERAETYYKSLGMNANQFMQFLSSEPKSLDANDPFVKHVLEIGKLELSNLKRQNMNQAKMLTAGNRSLYENPRWAHLKTDLDDLIGAADTLYTPELDKRIDERLGPSGGAPAKAPAKKEAASGGMIRVKKGNEVLDVLPSDLAAAKADGYSEVK